MNINNSVPEHITPHYKDTAAVMKEIYDSNLLLNQYILQTNGFFLRQLEQFFDIDKNRLLSLGNPLVLSYLVKKKELGIFFDDFDIATQPIGFLKDYEFSNENLLKSLDTFCEQNSSIKKTISPAFNLFQKIFLLQSSFINEPIYPYKHNIGSTLSNHLTPEAHIRFFSQDDYQSLFTFLLAYPQFKQLFYSKKIDDNLSFDDALFIEKRHIIEEFENSSFFCTTELLLRQFYGDNQHLPSFPHLQEHILHFDTEFQQELEQFNANSSSPLTISRLSTTLHPNVQRSLNSKSLSFDQLNNNINNDAAMLKEWFQNPTSSFLKVKQHMEGKIPLYLPNLPKSTSDLPPIFSDPTELLYASPLYILNVLMQPKDIDAIQSSSDYYGDYEDTLMQALIDNNIFFLTFPEQQISDKPLVISKKIWEIFSNNITNPNQIVLNYLILLSYSQENPIKIQFALELSDFEMCFLRNNWADSNTPFSLHHFLTFGMNFHHFFVNVQFIDKDLEIIDKNKLFFNNSFAMMEEIPFNQKVFDITQKNLLEKIKHIPSETNLAKYTLSYLNLYPKNAWNLFNDRIFNIRTPEMLHEKLEEFLVKFDSLVTYDEQSPLNNKAFRFYLVQSIVLSSIVNESISRQIDYLKTDIHSPLRNQFDNKDLTYHQKILNRKYFSYLDNYSSLPLVHFNSLSLSIVENHFKYLIETIEQNKNTAALTIENIDFIAMPAISNRFMFALFESQNFFHKYSIFDFSSHANSLSFLGNITVLSSLNSFLAFNIFGTSNIFFSKSEQTMKKEQDFSIDLERNILLLVQLANTQKKQDTSLGKKKI